MNQAKLVIFIVSYILSLISFPILVQAETKNQDLIFEKPNKPYICPRQSVIETLKKYQVQAGETAASIAAKYDLLPQTIIAINPQLQNQKVADGEEIYIPAYNGFIIDINPGQSYIEIASRYVVKAELLWEVNGCKEIPPNRLFIPSTSFNVQNIPNLSTITDNSNINNSNINNNVVFYPLDSIAPIGFDYGNQQNPLLNQRVFHSGIDLIAPEFTPVFAVTNGLVVYAGNKGDYGNLVVINHANGKQTRYAHLSQVIVKTGQNVSGGEQIGTVGITGKPDIKQTHVHFEVRSDTNQGWKSEDPKGFLPQ